LRLSSHTVSDTTAAAAPPATQRGRRTTQKSRPIPHHIQHAMRPITDTTRPAVPFSTFQNVQ
jgi:hypothetical protein